MTPPNREQLLKLRSWRTWLLAVAITVQGAQYVIHPELPLHLSTYSALSGFERSGWEAFGCGCLLVGALLSFESTELFGHAGGVIIYLTLATANAYSGVVPAVLFIPAGLHGGELAFAIWHLPGVQGVAGRLGARRAAAKARRHERRRDTREDR